MSETVDTLGEHPDDIKGKRYISELFGPTSPLAFKKTLDTRGFIETGAEVFQVEVTDPQSVPAQLGEWATEYIMGIPPLPGVWATPPRQDIAMKVVNLESNSAGFERRALLIGNAIFPENASRRPVRLYGYGRGTIHNPSYNEQEEKGYFLEELIPPQYDSFHTYVEKKGELSPQEATALAANLNMLLQPLHELGITHGDLEDEKGNNNGKEGHLFIEPDSGDLRLIDWSHSGSKDIDPKTFSTTLYLDHVGIAQILTYADFSQLSRAIQEQLEKLYVLSDVQDPGEEGELPKYPRDASGTLAQYEDIQKLLLLLKQEEEK